MSEVYETVVGIPAAFLLMAWGGEGQYSNGAETRKYGMWERGGEVAGHGVESYPS